MLAIKKIICLILVLCTVFLVSSCTIDGVIDEFDENDDDTHLNGGDVTDNPNGEEPPEDEIEDIVSSVTFLSYDPDDYIGDLETFVYGLLINELEYIYDVFPACIQLSDSYYVYGLAYTDYSECYVNDDETVAYFMSGFLPFVGELDIPDEDFESGLYIHDLEFEYENTKFVWKYRSEAFLEHCVVYGAYLQYGVSEDGYITYNAIPYEREKCDTSLGALYSYDDTRYLYDTDFGNYTPITGESLAIEIDYDELEREINAILEEQNANFMTYDITTVAYTAQDAVVSFLLSMQEETFLGYSVDYLIEASQSLNPLECFRITSDGLTVIDIAEIPPEEPTAFCKWLVGTACVIVTAIGIVGSMVFVACPPLSALAGAVTGAAIETFMQVVIDNKTLGDVSWEKVAIAACAGAISGFLGPYIQTLGGASYFFIDSAVDGLIGATEQAIFAWMDGKSGKEVLSSFGYGFALGAGLSAAFKVVGKIASKGVEGLSALAEKASKKLPPKLTAAATKFVKPIKNLGSAIGDSLNKLQQKADSTIFHSKFVAQKQFYKQLSNLVENTPDKLAQKSILAKGSLKPDGILDVSNNTVSKKQLYEIFMQSKEGDIVGKYVFGDELVYIVKHNGVADVAFDNKYIRVLLENGITSDRTQNLTKASGKLRELWMDDPSSIPEELKKAILDSFPDKSVAETLEDITDYKMYQIIQGSSYVLHESCDLKTITLVPRALHDKGIGGVSHMGGVSLAKYVKEHMGSIYFEAFVSAAASGTVIGGIYE